MHRLALVVLLSLAACARAAAPRSGTHDVELNGARLHFTVRGQSTGGAPPVVFLHGGPGQGSAHFEGLAGAHMERRLRMVWLDQRGSGLSERPASGDYALPTLVEDIEALRRHLGVERIALIGQSFGGLLALEYAARHPERVSHLVFVAGLWDTALQCRLRLRKLAELRPEAWARVRADTLAPDGSRRHDCDLVFAALQGAEREAYDRQIMYPDPSVERRMDSVNAARGVRNTGELGRALFQQGGLGTYQFRAFDRITMPVLVLAGRHDGAAVPEGLRELASQLPRARYVELERSGHFPYLDEPERFAELVAGFVSGG